MKLFKCKRAVGYGDGAEYLFTELSVLIVLTFDLLHHSFVQGLQSRWEFLELNHSSSTWNVFEHPTNQGDPEEGRLGFLLELDLDFFPKLTVIPLLCRQVHHFILDKHIDCHGNVDLVQIQAELLSPTFLSKCLFHFSSMAA